MKQLIISVLISILFITGCATSSKNIPTPEEKKVELVWPLPPDEPKIKYIKKISKESDVVKKKEKGFWTKTFEIITGFISGGGEGEVRLIRPYGIAEYDDVVYVADQQLRVVHIFDFKESQYYQIGRSKSGQLVSPIGVVVDNNSNIYISDSVLGKIFVYNQDRINIFDIGGKGQFSRPTGLAINKNEELLYVADTVANKIKVFDLKGNFKFEFGKRGSEKGIELNFPVNIFLDKNGCFYVCDSMNFKIKIFDKDGNFISMFGKIGDKLGYFARPKGVAVDSEGHIYVVDSLFDRVQIFNEKGALLLAFGLSGGGKGEFWLPSGLFIDSDDRIYVADSYNNRVQIFKYLKDSEKTSQSAALPKK